ncbi:Hcp family type VI secretion system effector [Pseudomonas cremoricolorata]|uniref:Major exported protein n=1 Tax=Pseudomonas cremoricolorata TaxID=157783 RepID=A0A089YG33_9PSED|nr:Hcp family type VI secretion system effector [Pseudomonas cremoricolorata]AIR90638.1 major exported protein [Pseudomonas cremoricolorata]
MPTPAYIKITGTTQGNITQGAFTADSVGNIYQEGHEDQILVHQIKHRISVPTDPHNGQPSGQRVHGPLIFTCALNKAVPLLYSALSTGEVLTEVELSWYRTSVEGIQEHFFTTKLTDAVIVDMDLEMPHIQDEANKPFTQFLRVSLAYRGIEWEHLIASTAGADDWRKPKE